MTTSATQLMTRVRTWLLVAELTALVIALGAMIGGAFLWLFAGLAVIFNLLVSSIAAMIAGVVSATANVLQLGVSRQRGYLADATAARLLGGAIPLADALESIERTHTPPLQVKPVTASMYIANPLSRGEMSTLFSTNPPVAERVRRLRAYDREGASAIGARAPAAGLS